MQGHISLFDLVTASDAIGPNIAELIEVIESSPGDEHQVLDWCQRRLQKGADLPGVVAHERRLRSEYLQDEGPFLFGIYLTIEKSRGNGQP